MRDAEKALEFGSDEPRTVYHAARIFAQAASGTAVAGPNDRAERQRHLERAVDLLHKALEALPLSQRSDFWRNKVEHDAGLNPVRATAAFRALVALYARAK
jgi:hypothetical protein